MTAAPRSRHGDRRRWWRTPVLRRLPRRLAAAALAGCAVVALLLGSAAGAMVQSVGDDAPAVRRTPVGPMLIHLPADLGPWTTAPSDSFDAVRGSDSLVIDGAWGAMAPGPVVVTVLTAKEGTHGGVAAIAESMPDAGDVEWDGRQDHAVGTDVADGVRELMLAVESDDGDLVILSVSGPVSAFDSGTLEEAFRTSRLGG